MTAKVSVIIPVHNDAPYLIKCLNSVANQTLEDIEIICVNDGSTDNSLDILNEYASKDSRFKIINQENAGAAVARNKGIEIATGDYLSILDADDFFENNMLEYMYYTAKTEQSDVVICGFYLYDNRSREDIQIEYPHIPETLISPFRTEEVKDNLFLISLETAWTKLWKADLIKKNNVSFENVPCCNDVAFTCTALACSNKISFTNIPFVHYRVFNKNRLTNNSERSFIMQKTFSTLYKNLVEKKVYDKYKNSYISFIKARMQGGFKNWIGENSKKALLAIPQILPPPIVQEFFAPKDRPAVSIIVPVYNMEKYLPQCLDSLVSQTLKNIEIICVDDGSTDSSLKILQDYAAQDNRIKILTQPNSRQSIARRNAMKIATGEYIQNVDADDYIDLDASESLYLYSKLYDLDMCFFMGKNFSDDGFDKKLREHLLQLQWLPEGFPAVFSYKNLLNVLAILNVGACMTFYRHDFLKEHNIQWLDEKIAYEDTPFFIESLFSAEKIGALRESIYHRRKHAGATTENLISNFPDYCSVVLKAIKIVKRLADETALSNYFHSISKNTYAVFNHGCSDEAKRKFKKDLYDFFKESEKISGLRHDKEIRQWCKVYEKRKGQI